MSETIKIAFEGTKEQELELREMLRQEKEHEGALMPALQKAQAIYGYLPKEVQEIVAEELKISLSEVYGVVTFYSQFSLVPKGKYKVGVCLGTACYVKGAGDVLDRVKQELKIDSGGCTLDRQFSLEATRCIGCCGLAPVVTINDDVYGKVTVDKVADILAKYDE